MYRTHASYSEPNSHSTITEISLSHNNDPYLSYLQNAASKNNNKSHNTLAAFSRTLPNEEENRRSVLRVPLQTWTHNGPLDAVIALDFKKKVEWKNEDIIFVFYGACRLGAILGITDPQGTSKKVISPDIDNWNWTKIVEQWRAEVEKQHDLQWTSIQWSNQLDQTEWLPLGLKNHKESMSYGVLHRSKQDQLAIPLRLGPVQNGYFLCHDRFTDSPERLNHFIAGITAVWVNLSFLKCTNWNVNFSQTVIENEASCLWHSQINFESDSETIQQHNKEIHRRVSLYTQIPDPGSYI